MSKSQQFGGGRECATFHYIKKIFYEIGVHVIVLMEKFKAFIFAGTLNA